MIKINNDKKLLEIVKNHHRETDDKLINYFKYSDDKN